MCKLMLCVINTITGMFVMYDITGSGYTTKEHFLPIAIVFIFSWMIASLFLNIFMSVTRTLMMCLAVDMDLNDGRPEFGPVSFHEAIHTVKAHNKKSGGYVQKKGKDDEEDLLSTKSSVASASDATPVDNGDHENLF